MHSERIALAIFSRLYSRERSFTSLWSPSRLGWWTARRVLWGLVGKPVNGQPASPAGGFLPCVVARYGGCGCQALGAVGAATASTVGAREDLGPGLSGEGVGRGVLSLPGCSGAPGGGVRAVSSGTDYSSRGGEFGLLGGCQLCLGVSGVLRPALAGCIHEPDSHKPIITLGRECFNVTGILPRRCWCTAPVRDRRVGVLGVVGSVVPHGLAWLSAY